MKKIFPIILFSASILFVEAQPVTKSMKRLPDTGQNTSYTNTFGEDSDFNIYAPYYNINGNGTVTDTITGLMWQKTDGGEMTIENAAIYCNTLTLGGYSDWRLPNCHELFSILNHDRVNPSEDTIYFTKTLAEYWWSSQRQVGDSSKVWVTNAGGGVGNHPKTETISAGGPKKFHVRAVRDITTPTLIPNHFINNGNGTITDQITNITWQQIQYADTLTWENALTYADTLSLSGYTDWRLPNIKELQSINDETITNPSIKSVYFGVNTAKKYWSSTSLPNQTTRAWYLDTQFGITTYANKTNKINLLCVRGNQINTTGINENKISMQDVTVFPNPFNAFINLKPLRPNAKFELYNYLGEVIFSGLHIEQNDFSNLQNGIYLLKVIDKTTSFVKLLKE